MSDRRIHITRQGVRYGPYPESSLEIMLANGQLLPTDLVWFEGAEGWQALQEFLDADAAETPPATPSNNKSAEESAAAEQVLKIKVLRNGEAIGPYSMEKAREYFIAGQLLPTDVACADAAGEDWKPLNEVLGLPAPIPMSTSSEAKSGKGKKRAMIAGISVLVISLITVGILYGPKLLGGGKGELSGDSLEEGDVDASKELVERVVKAFQNDDKDAMFELSNYGLSRGDLGRLYVDVHKGVAPLAKAFAEEEGITFEEAMREMGEDRESFIASFEDGREQARETASSHMEDIRSLAVKEGVNWSDVEISEIKTLGLTEALGGYSPFVKVHFSIISNSKEFALQLSCVYASSLGLIMNSGAVYWQGPGGIPSWGLGRHGFETGANEILSQNRIRVLGTGIIEYADKNKYKMPVANKWCDEIFNEVGGGKAFISPQAPNAKKLKTDAKHCHYAMNAAVGGKEIFERPFGEKQVVVLFEAELGWNGTGGLEDAKKFAKERKPRKLAVFFVNGESKLVLPEELDQLRWTP